MNRNPMSGVASLAAIAALALCGFQGGSAPYTVTVRAQTNANPAPAASPQRAAATRSVAKAFGLNGGNATWRASYPNGPGWTHAQVKRMARRRRNVIRNRKAHR